MTLRSLFSEIIADGNSFKKKCMGYFYYYFPHGNISTYSNEPQNKYSAIPTIICVGHCNIIFVINTSNLKHTFITFIIQLNKNVYNSLAKELISIDFSTKHKRFIK